MARTMQTSNKSGFGAHKAAAAPLKVTNPKEEKTPLVSKVPQNGGVSKAKRAKSKTPPKRAMYQLRSKLNKEVDSQNPQKLEQEQSLLLRRASIALAEEGLELPGILEIAAGKFPDTHPITQNRKEGRRSKIRPTKRYMDESEFLEPDETEELGLSTRYIPQIGLRRRVGRKPAKIPFGIWMAYKHLDDFVYRQSLSAEEALSLPSDEDAFAFQSHDGAKPSLPPGFSWDDQRRLVDERPSEQDDI